VMVPVRGDRRATRHGNGTAAHGAHHGAFAEAPQVGLVAPLGGRSGSGTAAGRT